MFHALQNHMSWQWMHFTCIESSQYIFPPFSLMAKILQKMEQDLTEAVVISPIWPTQAWLASLLQMISGSCLILPKPQDILSLTHKPGQKIPLTKMRLGVFRLSGRHYSAKVYRKRLRTPSSLHEEIPPSDSTAMCVFVEDT